MDIKNKKFDLINGIKNVFQKIINFYYEPFSTISTNKRHKQKIKKPVSKSKITGKTKSLGFINQIIEYYGKKIYIPIFVSIISVISAVYLILLFGISYLWLAAYIITFISFISFYFGIKASLQRKRSIIDGYLRFMRDYLIHRKDITIKTHILEAKEESYPAYFGEELRKMKLGLNTKQSYTVLSEFFEDPKNQFPELLTLKNLSLSVISTKDDSISNALSEQLEYIENSRTVLSSKLGFSKFFVYFSIGFIFFIQAFLVYQFSSTLGSSFSSNSGGGFNLEINLVPNSINYFFLLYIGGISIVLLLMATDLGTYDEDKIANHTLFIMLIMIALSSIIFFLNL
jgi:hypothetical protein